MTCPAPIAELLNVLAQPDGRPAVNGAIETFLAPHGCLSCGGTVWYPFDGALWDEAHCRGCGKVVLVTSRGGVMHRWIRPGALRG